MPNNGRAGPLEISVDAQDEELARVARSYLELFSRRWNDAPRSVAITMRRHRSGEAAYGNFLAAAHMSVDRYGERYLADTQYGFVASGRCEPDRKCDEWCIDVPPETGFGEPQIGDLEDLFSLICTVGWREEGYVALHAGAVAKNDTCALLCASSGGGKSTLTTALMHNGWRTLGDDKLLLRREPEGGIQLRSLLQTFNLDPATRRWFDFGDLEALPRYSAWTVKRRVPLDHIAPGTALAHARPTHVVRVQRNNAVAGITARTMPKHEILPTLLKQIVLPADREVAAWILGEAAACAASVDGLTLEIGDDAYARSGWLQAIEEALL